MSHYFLLSPFTKRTPVIHHLSSTTSVGFFLSIVLLSLFCQAGRLEAQTVQQAAPKQLTGHEDHRISLNDAATLTMNFRSTTGATENTILGEYFGKDALAAALNQEKCIGLRIYYGKRGDGTPVLVLVGVDPSGSDMTSGLVLENGFPCPPICDSGNSLIDALNANSVISELSSSVHLK